MKRVIAGLMCVLLLSGCSSESVGIIGGADGPTAIFVTEGESEAFAESVRLIRVEGSLYYDTGKASSLVPRCGTLDGNLEMSAGEFEVPQGDNESNFETSGYQSVTSITKEVPLDGNWRIFKKFPDTNRDLNQYKYVLNLKGRHPNAVSDSEYIVLTNDPTVDFDRVSKAMFSSQSTDFLDCYVLPVLQEDKWGIRLWAENVTDTGLTIVCEQFGGGATGTLQTGDWYTLEVMNENNEWEAAPFLPHEHEIAWNSIAYGIQTNEQTEFEVDWEWLYGALPEGHYRIGKEIMDLRAPGDFDKAVYYADFFVE
ncbi:MAG: hypothetical protein IJ435_07125 [Clostridia bacterium]|nr:hypothetical protein [Clostridia bacterium]